MIENSGIPVDSCEIPIHTERKGSCLRVEPASFYTLAPMEVKKTTKTQFSDFTTTGIGGPISEFVWVDTEAELVEAVREADMQDIPVLVLGGGSNLLVGDVGFAGRVVRDRRAGAEVISGPGCGGVMVRTPAGYGWDEFVCEAIQNDWMGLESLSGIPGTVGAAPVQNIGAYGHEVGQFISSVKVYDRAEKRIRYLAVGELGLGYRDSLIKRSLRDKKAGGGQIWQYTGRYVVLEVNWQLRFASLSAPVKYQQLAGKLGVSMGQRVSLTELRDAVLSLRYSKGMVLNQADRDTYSTGSFFTNPILTDATAAKLPQEAPRFPVLDSILTNPNTWEAPALEGLVKTSAAWLIEHAGIKPGYSLGRVQTAAVSSKHVLALTNRGQAKAVDIATLARDICTTVKNKYGVQLEPEPVCVNLKI